MTTPDPVHRYLGDLRASLRGRAADRIVAEAEDHLREAIAAGLEFGLTEAEAQDAAISAFGSVRAVVRAHQTRVGRAAAIVVDAGLAALKLAWLFLLAGAVSLPVTLAYLKLSGSPAVSQMSYLDWLVHPAWLGWAIPGLLLFGGYRLARRMRRRRTLFSGYFPLVAAVFFTAAAVGFAVLGRSAGGPGIAMAALAAGYAVQTPRALRRQRNAAGTA